MSCFNCCFLTHIWVSQEWGKVVWYSHLVKNFQQFVVIRTAKGFNIVNEAEVGVFLEFPCFLYDQTNIGNLLLAPLKTDSFPRRDSTLQSCPTLCDPTDCSPPGSPVPGILQARTLEWVAISCSSAWKWEVKVKSLSGVQLSATPWTAAYQDPLSMGFSRQEYWSGVPLPSKCWWTAAITTPRIK